MLTLDFTRSGWAVSLKFYGDIPGMFSVHPWVSSH